MKFENIYVNTEKTLENGLLSLWTPGNHAMKASIQKLFEREPFIGEPLFQSAFGWEQIPAGTNWKNGFDPAVAKMIEDIGTKNGTRPWAPYTHQKASWDLLNNATPHQAQSIVVTSGTGSGKTECFLYPVLNDLYMHRGEGVQAVFMYPLNALANDQKGRIEKCCQALGLQFACYNGNTKEGGAYRPTDIEITSRDAIRTHRPDLLLTNPSMLEYIMVRDDDRPIVEPNNPNQKTSSLRWIIIDEAHTYTGSAAVELKYEIKRVIEAFGADMKDIHFACTSATIGGNPALLTQFIHELTGQDPTRINVIGGSRVVPVLTTAQVAAHLSAAGLTYAPANVLALRDKLNSVPYLSTDQIWDILHPGLPYSQSKAVDVMKDMDNLCEVSWTNGASTEFLLMARAHFFMREPNGLYACLNPQCSHHSDSPMGFITSLDQQVCPHCGAPLFELAQCKSCGEFMYLAEDDQSQQHNLTAIREGLSGDIDNDFADDEDDDQNQTTAPAVNNISGAPVQFKASLAGSRNPNLSYLRPIYHNLAFNKKKASRVAANASSGNYVTYLNANNVEFCAHCGQKASSNKISGFRVSMDTMKQIVTPDLLAESTPNAGQFWGKYISFTDSRQKTAISAKQFNIGVERDYAMSRILKCLTDDHLFKGVINPVMIADIDRYGIISPELFNHISNDSTDMAAYQASVLRAAIGRRLLRGAGSLETMGLITVLYPDLSSLPMPTELVTWNNNHPGARQFTQQDWHDFLKICLDYNIRLSNCIQPISTSLPTESNYIRDNHPSKMGFIASPNGGKTWPSIQFDGNGTPLQIQNRLVLILCAALGIKDELDLDKNKVLVSELLKTAWVQLTGDTSVTVSTPVNPAIPHVMSTDDGGVSFFLDMSATTPYNMKCLIKLNEKADVCPVSNKLLDVTFMGYSPMISGYVQRENMEQYKCKSVQVDIPVINSKGITTPTQIEAWLSSSPEVANLKAQGLWSNYMQKAFCLQNAYVAAEHSAQIDRSKLELFTKQFKGDPSEPGRLNILNCSTTMEMGVDIGDIDLVFLSNVPPSAANYLQRAGRAGRFGQSKAAAFTTCTATPAGLEAFFAPNTMLVDKAGKRMPKESKVIVERHINSFFFRDFVLCGGMSVTGGSTVADFFLPGATGANSIADNFAAHLSMVGNRLDNTFAKIFPASYQCQASLTETANKIIVIKNNFLTIYNDLLNAYNQASTAAKTAASYQLTRFATQGLIGYLSEMQFFPNANMPTGIVEFDATSLTDKKKIIKLTNEIKALRQQLQQNTIPQHMIRPTQDAIKSKKKELKDLKKSSIVSREAMVALNEYAPEQTVVVDESNYVSFALSDRSSYGTKSMPMYIARCETCSWTEYSASQPPQICPKCGKGNMVSVGLHEAGAFTLAKQVVGYRTDFGQERNRQEKNSKRFYNINSFIPDFNWSHFHSEGLCDVDGADGGKIVFCNKGNGFGFAICKENVGGSLCGHAVIDVPFNQKPNIAHGNHKPKWSARPPYVAPGHVDRHVVLTSDIFTSYVALRFWKDTRRKIELASESFLYSIGTVLTNALCDCLAIDRNEISFGVNMRDGKNFLYIYDTNKGGSGYSTRLLDPTVFHNVITSAYNIVDGYTCNCKNQPGGACAKCLMDKGTFAFAGKLSTSAVYQWLKTQMKQYKTVPAHISAISANSLYEPRTLVEILDDAVNNTAIQEIEFFIPLENELIAKDWNDTNSVIGKLLREAQTKGKKISLFLEYDKSDKDIISQFSLYNTATALSWFNKIEGAEFSGSTRTALVLKDTGGRVENFFTEDYDALPLSNLWGDKCEDIYVDNIYPAFNILPLPTQAQIQALLAGGKRIVKDGSVPDGVYYSDRIFRDIINPYVINGDVQIDQGIKNILQGQHVKINFAENFLTHPLACIMLSGLIKEMATLYNMTIDSIALDLDGNSCVNNSTNKIPLRDQYIRYNFDTQAYRDAFIMKLIKSETGVMPTIGINQKDHHRWLRFTNSTGEMVEIRPDHGVGGGWESSLKHKDLPTTTLPIDFHKIIPWTTRIEPSILFYVAIER